MKKRIIQIVRWFKPDTVWRKFKFRYRLRKAKVMDIDKNPSLRFKSIYHIKDETWETMCIPEIFNISKQCNMLCYHNAQDILEIPNARIMSGSDIVQTEDMAIWEKAKVSFFSIVKPADSNILKYDATKVYIAQPERRETIQGKCVSMLGVHAHLWAHFLVQYLPKLYYAEDAKLFDHATIILPKYKDENIKEIIQSVLGKYSEARIIEAQDHTEYVCEKLMYIPHASFIADDADFVMPYETVIPKMVIERIHKEIIEPLQDRVSPDTCKHERIYLSRRNPSYRATVNNEELEEYFKSKGFFFVTGATLSLQEKANLFYHAKVIAGAYSAGWINTMFCKGAKGLILANNSKAMDSYYLTLAKPENIQILCNVGDDLYANHQTDFYMPIERVDEAYKQLANS